MAKLIIYSQKLAKNKGFAILKLSYSTRRPSEYIDINKIVIKNQNIYKIILLYCTL